MEPAPASMPFGTVPSLLIATGMALAVKWRGKAGWMEGAVTGVLMAVFLLIGERFYGFVYSPAGGESGLRSTRFTCRERCGGRRDPGRVEVGRA